MVDGLAIHNSLSYRMVYLCIQVTDLSEKIHTRKTYFEVLFQGSID